MKIFFFIGNAQRVLIPLTTALVKTNRSYPLIEAFSECQTDDCRYDKKGRSSAEKILPTIKKNVHILIS
jgi:hypothetical protein